jgi:dephospho-CoA kinase
VAGAGARVPFVGLTGGIAAGKSEALRALERLGAATLSTDVVTHDLLRSAEMRRLLVDRFGPSVAPDGEIDRNALAEAVFADEEQRRWLEGELWPRVGRAVAEWREQVERSDPPPPAAVVEVPLLFEAGMESVFDMTIAVVADEPVREERAGARGHSGVESRTARQLSQDEKAARADMVVSNDGSIEDLERELSRVLGTMVT